MRSKPAPKRSVENLTLNSLEIKGFRGFRHLTIERLGRVNLIVGKNGVGKSALLEAVRLYAQRGAPALIWELLVARDESTTRGSLARDPLLDPADYEEALAIKYLFHGRKDFRESTDPISIGPMNAQRSMLSISLNWSNSRTVDNGVGRSQSLGIEPDESNLVDNGLPILVVQLESQQGTGLTSKYRINPPFARRTFSGIGQNRQELREIPSIYTPANGLSSEEIGRLWNSTALTPREEDVLAALHIIAPQIIGIDILTDEQLHVIRRVPIVRVEGLDNPIPLRSLGEGLNRVLGIALALVSAKDGLLLIDEIESGVHYSIQPNVWRLIFETASRLNVQVFATTHSRDCIEAFTKAATENKQEEGVLIRLSERKGDIVATLYDEQELAIATRGDIEVR